MREVRLAPYGTYIYCNINGKENQDMCEELKKMYEEFLEALDEEAEEPGIEKLKEIVNAEVKLFSEHFGEGMLFRAFVIAALCEVISDVFRAEMVKDRADVDLMNELRDAFEERVAFAGSWKEERKNDRRIEYEI